MSNPSQVGLGFSHPSVLVLPEVYRRSPLGRAVPVSSYVLRCGRSNSLRCPLWCWLPSWGFAGPRLSARSGHLLSIASLRRAGPSPERAEQLSRGGEAEARCLFQAGGSIFCLFCCKTVENQDCSPDVSPRKPDLAASSKAAA